MRKRTKENEEENILIIDLRLRTTIDLGVLDLPRLDHQRPLRKNPRRRSTEAAATDIITIGTKSENAPPMSMRAARTADPPPHREAITRKVKRATEIRTVIVEMMIKSRERLNKGIEGGQVTKIRG